VRVDPGAQRHSDGGEERGANLVRRVEVGHTVENEEGGFAQDGDGRCASNSVAEVRV